MIVEMEKPRFRKTGENQAGYPVYERVREAANDDGPEKPGRRGFLLGGAAALAAAAIPNKLGDGTYDGNLEAANDEQFEERETIETEATFENELTGYRAFVRLERDEVQFVDQYNRPVGEPVILEDFVGPLPEGVTVEAGQAEEYLYSLGERDEIGLPTGNIPPRWLAQKRAELQSEYPDRTIDGQHNVVGSFRAALAENDEPELVERIRDGRISSYLEIVEHFSQKPVVGAEDFTREEYVREAIAFDEEVPSAVQSELRRVIVGLCGQESKFNNGLTSSAGAKGIFQFMPETWASYGAEPEETSSLRKQVEVAGRFFSDLYRQVVHHIGEEALAKYQERYPDAESFQTDLLVPLMINSYNAGAARVAEAARLYIERNPDAPLSGKELFLAIADFAESSTEGENETDEGRYLNAYGRHAREYTTRVYATADVLNAT